MSRLDILKRFLRLLAAEANRSIRRRLAASLLLALLGSALTGLAPLALKSVIDAMTRVHASPAAATGHFALLSGAAYLATLCIGRVLSDLRPLLAGHAEQQLHARISRRYFAHLLELPMVFHAGRQTGALMNGLSQATAACQLVTNSLMQCMPVSIELVTVLVVLGHLGQPALAAIFAASAVAYAFVFANGARQVRTHGRAVSDANLRTHATFADSLLNVETIKCFNAGAAMRNRFDGATAELEGRWRGLHRQRTHVALQVVAVFGASVGGSLAVAADAVAHDTLTIGGFVLATVYMLQMVRPLELLGTAVRDAAQAIEFARPLVEVLEAPTEGSAQRSALEDARPTAAEADKGPGASRRPPAIAFSDVWLAYGNDRAVLKSFSLDVAAGTMVAIVGASGAGKSSIARLLLRLLDPDAGRILWDRSPLDRLRPEMLRSRIGFVPQDTTLFNDTIAANIAIGRPGASREEIEQAARRAQLQTLAQSLPDRYDTLVGERGLKLSGGERQRIAIARAILRRPQVYLFDEVSSMLDAPTEAALLRDLKVICAGCTTIFITHRLAAARSADVIVVLEDGRVAERGSHAELIARRGSYQRMWRLQAMHGADPRCPPVVADSCRASATGPGRAAARRPAVHRRRA
jgi:ABC-type multidrug transport system fused ATPase/permease subunit